MKKIIILFAALAVLSSCTDEHIWFGGSKEIGIKTVDIYRTARIPSTKSDGSELLCSFPLPSDDTDQEYCLEVWISDAVTDAATRGAQINSASELAAKYGSFTMDAYSNSSLYYDGQNVLKDMTVIYSDDNWTFENGQKYFWPDNGDLTFCSYSPVGAPVKDMKYDSSKDQVTFEYALPAHTDDNNDAINQKDVMFGLDTENRVQDHGNAYIHFYHALTSVKFVNSDKDDYILKGVTIKSVTLKNFYGSGSAVFSKDDKGGKFAWTPDESSLSSYTQEFNTVFDSDGNNSDGNNSFDTTSDGSMTFMMIPQKLDDDAQIIIEFDRQAHNQIVLNVGNLSKDDFWSPADETNRTNEAEQLKDWSEFAGKTITFKVTMKDMRVASLDLTADNGIFTVTNNGTDPVYVRATMVVNLEDANNKVIKTCFETDSPKLYSYDPIDTGKWTFNETSGCWESNEPLEAGGSLEFIKGFTADDITGIVYDHIDVSVLMQGVFDKSEKWN